MSEVKGPGFTKPMGEAEELTKALIGKTVDNGKAIAENLAAIGEVNAGVSGLKALIEKIPEQGGHVQAISQRLESMEKSMTDLTEKYYQVAAVYHYDAGMDSKRAKISQELTAEMKAHLQEIKEEREKQVKYLTDYGNSMYALYEKPSKKSIRYTHVLGWPIFVFGILLVIIGVLIYLLRKTSLQAEQLVQNDLQWRFLTVTSDSAAMHNLHKVKAAYQADPWEFTRFVNKQENRRDELQAKWILQENTKKEIDELENKSDTLPALK